MNYIYNGVELPNMNEVWTDKSTYPYAFICDAVTADVSYVMLYICNRVAEYGTVDKAPSYGTCLHLSNPMSCRVYVFTYSQEEADELAPVLGYSTKLEANKWCHLTDDNRTSAPLVVTHSAFWTSHDIINTTDNSVYLKASEPIPVGPKFNLKKWLTGYVLGLVSQANV